ncbi:hypothetical protein Q7P37_005352 [Cladosporium fusiforme]
MTPQPFAGRTPEALLGRNDSKNPATTCRGITNSGRPCRRAIASPKARDNGLVEVYEDDEGGVEEAIFYCHDHKSQAGSSTPDGAQPASGRKKTDLFPLKEVNSVDSFVQRLGVQGVGSEISTKARRKRNDGRRHSGAQSAPYAEKYGLGQPERRKSHQQKSSFWSMLCCGGGNDHDDDYIEVVRHKKRMEGSRPSDANASPRPASSKRPSNTSNPPQTSLPHRPATHQKTTPSNSQTGQLLSLIPPTLPPATASALLTELGKPPNPNDEEGYIYIFWLTPNETTTPDATTARSLLSPPDLPQRGRRISDVVSEFSAAGSSSPRSRARGSATTNKKPSILLKIGRANNITRRMNEWQRQCGYALTLVRFYPYVSSSPSPSPAPSPGSARHRSSSASAAVRKVPCVKRVERLIHLELADTRVMRDCAACGKEHREWFEVEGSEKGVRGVDEVVRRWVGWGEGQVG